MLDFNLPIKIVNKRDGHPSFFVKEVLFHNTEYALLKLDMEKKDLEFAGLHGDIVIVALPDPLNTFFDNGYNVISKHFDNHKAENARKIKIESKIEYNEIINNKIMNLHEKQRLLVEVLKDLGYPNIGVLVKRNENYTEKSIELIRRYEGIGYIYESDNFDDYIDVTDEFIARNHNQIFPICEHLKEIGLYREAHHESANSIVRINKVDKKIDLKITDAWGSNALYITKGMSLNKKDSTSPVVEYVQNYNEFKKLLSALNETMYNHVDLIQGESEW